jgi:hypothetical protein
MITPPGLFQLAIQRTDPWPGQLLERDASQRRPEMQTDVLPVRRNVDGASWSVASQVSSHSPRSPSAPARSGSRRPGAALWTARPVPPGTSRSASWSAVDSRRERTCQAPRRSAPRAPCGSVRAWACPHHDAYPLGAERPIHSLRRTCGARSRGIPQCPEGPSGGPGSAFRREPPWSRDWSQDSPGGTRRGGTHRTQDGGFTLSVNTRANAWHPRIAGALEFKSPLGHHHSRLLRSFRQSPCLTAARAAPLSAPRSRSRRTPASSPTRPAPAAGRRSFPRHSGPPRPVRG